MASPASSRHNSANLDGDSMGPEHDGGADGGSIIDMYHSNQPEPASPAVGNGQRPAPYDPTMALDSFSAMSINDGRPPVMPAAAAHDPIARSASSMSMRTYQSSMRSYPPQRNGLPPAPNYGMPPRQPYPPEQQEYHDRAPAYSYDDQVMGYRPPGPQYGNHLYAAASNVLGMGPPPGQMPGLPPPQHQMSLPPGPPQGQFPAQQIGSPMSGYASSISSFRSSDTSLASSMSASHIPPGAGSAPSLPPIEDDEIPNRPPLPHEESFSPVGRPTAKAVDLSAPPYTKEYIDQYRQRIKADPDPESHFAYAKYLIDAARKIRANSQEQRGAKKYTEVLVQEALKVVRRLATQGEPYDEAQFFLANCYGTGSLGLQVDHERAYHLYLQAAKQNHAAACYRVAVCNEIGAGTRKEPMRAAAFYRKAASLGDTPAMYKLGMILLHGSLGEQKNPRESVGWLRRAAEQADTENPHALHELGLLHEHGQIVPHDPALAKGLFTQSAHLGYTASQFKLGQCYEYGSLTCPVDPRRSIAWYTKAAEKGDPEAELALSGWYLTGSEGVLKQSDSEAYLWARRAANKGLSKAEYAVGYYAEVGIGIKQDMEFAKRWYMRAAAQGNKRAMNRLTEMKRQGNKRTNMSRPTRQQAKDECVII